MRIEREIVEKMMDEINYYIEIMYEEREENGCSQWYYRTLERVSGMVCMLRIATDKRWNYDKNGVYVVEE